MRKAAAAAGKVSMSSSIPVDDIFALFGMKREFSLDEKELEKKYFDLQKNCHPDKFVTESVPVKVARHEESAKINTAYRILRNPLARAEYLLVGFGKPSPELLTEIMEIQEKLVNAGTMEEIVIMQNFAESEKEKSIANLKKYFSTHNLSKAAEETVRLKYLTKFSEEIKARRKSAAA